MCNSHRKPALGEARADCRSDLFSSPTSKFFGRKCDKELVGGTGGRTPCISMVFFSSYKLPKTVTVTTLLLFDYVTLLCGKFLCIKLIEGPV